MALLPKARQMAKAKLEAGAGAEVEVNVDEVATVMCHQHPPSESATTMIPRMKTMI